MVILNEMVHDSRIVPLDGRDQLPDDMRQWMGSSRGRWDGDTLVVDTTHFTDQTASFAPSVRSSVGTGTKLHLTERFTRLDDDTLLYEFTVSDPDTWTAPFTAALPMKRGGAPMFEYACHEGNYGMLNPADRGAHGATGGSAAVGNACEPRHSGLSPPTRWHAARKMGLRTVCMKE